MDTKNEIQEFLTSRRARISPESAGLRRNGHRRVPGLRREEVAMLAGVSVDYYNKLERGNLSGVSEPVLVGIVAALRLTDVEERHLRDLMRSAETTVRSQRRRVEKPTVRVTVQRVLDSMTDIPAIVKNGRLDMVATNPLGRALFSRVFEGVAAGNYAKFIFLDPASREFLIDWEGGANDTVAVLRAAAGRDPLDRSLSDLVGELSTRSDDFRVRWAAHNVHQHSHGNKQLMHTIVGVMSLDYESLPLPADEGFTLVVYSVEPRSASADALQLLGSWMQTQDAASRANPLTTEA